jgi:hypothetical protein
MDDDAINDELALIEPSNDQLIAINGINLTINAIIDVNDAKHDVT